MTIRNFPPLIGLNAILGVQYISCNRLLLNVFQKSLSAVTVETSQAQMRDLKEEREALINKRKKIDTDLRLMNQEITKKVHYGIH